MPTTDYGQLAKENLADIDSVLQSLDDSQWEAATLCDGWRVRDLAGHFVVGTRVPVPRVAAKVMAGGFRLDAVVDRESRKAGDDHSIAELRDIMHDIATADRLTGVAARFPKKQFLADSTTHLLDIVTPLDIDRPIPDDRLVATLAALVGLKAWGSKQRAKGLRLVATDVDWTHGDGLEVRGTSRALILTLGGRSHLANTLSGDGASTLRKRL